MTLSHGAPVLLFPSNKSLCSPIPQNQNLDFLCSLFSKVAFVPLNFRPSFLCSPEINALVPLFPWEGLKNKITIYGKESRLKTRQVLIVGALRDFVPLSDSPRKKEFECVTVFEARIKNWYGFLVWSKWWWSTNIMLRGAFV